MLGLPLTLSLTLALVPGLRRDRRGTGWLGRVFLLLLTVLIAGLVMAGVVILGDGSL